MIGLIIATHGNSSVELIKGAEMFAGPLSQCRAWTLNPGDDIQKGEQMLEEYVDELDQEEGVLIMADLFGGTPSNLATKIALRRENVETVTGVNLPMIIQFVTERETQTLDELVESCIETAQDGIKQLLKIIQMQSFMESLRSHLRWVFQHYSLIRDHRSLKQLVSILM